MQEMYGIGVSHMRIGIHHSQPFHISNLPLRNGSWKGLCTQCAWLNASAGLIAIRMGIELWWWPMSPRVALTLTRFPHFIVEPCLAKKLRTLEKHLCIAIWFKSSSLSLFISQINFLFYNYIMQTNLSTRLAFKHLMMLCLAPCYSSPI